MVGGKAANPSLRFTTRVELLGVQMDRKAVVLADEDRCVADGAPPRLGRSVVQARPSIRLLRSCRQLYYLSFDGLGLGRVSC